MSNDDITRVHDCATCTDCLHDGHKCCGCYDGACCHLAETLRLRSEALNRVAEENEALRAKVEAVKMLVFELEQASNYAARMGMTEEGEEYRHYAGRIAAALAPQEAP